MALFENIDPGILGLMPSGKIVSANAPACELLGYPRKELEGCSLRTIAPEITAEDWSSFWSELDHKGLENRLQIRHPSCKQRSSVVFRVLFIDRPGLKYCMITGPGG
jgi:PAS domain S-box-containing protein